MSDVKVPATSRDKIIGWILLAIGILGILRAIQLGYDLHATRPGYTVGLMIGGIILNSLIPLVFVTSGHYYLSGRNAKRLAKKKGLGGQESTSQPISPVFPADTNANTYSQTPTTITSNSPQPPQAPQPDSSPQDPDDLTRQ